MKFFRPLIYISTFIIFFLIGFYVINKDNDPVRLSRTKVLLGTIVDIEVVGESEKAVNVAIEKAFKEIERIDSLFSTYNRQSPVSIINNEFPQSIVNEEIYHLLKLSSKYWKLTGGAFDVSLENIIKLWGFKEENPSVPKPSQLDSALQNSGWDKIDISETNLVKKTTAVGFNFGAIAKGYAVDKAIKVLQLLKVNKALVNAGGEIKCIGEWIVGIQHPRNENELAAVLQLNGLSVATSGDYENYFFENGKRYHHILNPKTGYPSDYCQSVSVVSKDAAEADALSTGLFVLGVEKGLDLVEELTGAEAMFIDSLGTIKYSSGFKKFFKK